MRPAGKRAVKLLGLCLFGIYLAALIYLLFFAEEYGRSADQYSYNVQPFREIRRYLRYYEILGWSNVLLNLAGNVIGFMPFGMLLPVFWKNARGLFRVALLSFEVSALVEFSQLMFRVGCFDVDDMILNTLGGCLGYLLFAAAHRLDRAYGRRRRKDGTEDD
jgi:glycopeptide antibiotics resistance protein